MDIFLCLSEKEKYNIGIEKKIQNRAKKEKNRAKKWSEHKNIYLVERLKNLTFNLSLSSSSSKWSIFTIRFGFAIRCYRMPEYWLRKCTRWIIDMTVPWSLMQHWKSNSSIRIVAYVYLFWKLGQFCHALSISHRIFLYICIQLYRVTIPNNAIFLSFFRRCAVLFGLSSEIIDFPVYIFAMFEVVEKLIMGLLYNYTNARLNESRRTIFPIFLTINSNIAIKVMLYR